MTRLESWLSDATRGLSKDSITQVRAEIAEHYESSLRHDVTPDEADRMAIAALGDAKTANRQYRRVLLTSREAKMLGQSNREAKAMCSGPLRGVLIAVCVALLCGAAAFFGAGAGSVAWNLILGFMLIALLSLTQFLPVFTPSRSRAVRLLKWIFLVWTVGAGFHWSWLSVACLWPLAYIEWTRISIRRKLPVAEWPKQLYL